jgi:hypothetical protein
MIFAPTTIFEDIVVSDIETWIRGNVTSNLGTFISKYWKKYNCITDHESDGFDIVVTGHIQKMFHIN